jgi:hypothetical protein
MLSKGYKHQIDCLSPVAVKRGQIDVCAPDHDTWGIVTCGICGEQFAIGPNRRYGSRRSEQDCVQSLEKALAEDHKRGESHRNWYELPD